MKSVSEIIQGICPDIPSQAIRDSVRLGRYTEGRNHPLLAKLNRSCDVLSILASWQKLVQSETPGVFIKPHQSPYERSTEATLLRQRKLLVQSGTDKKDIKIRGNSIFVRKINMAQLMLPTSSFIPLSFLQSQRKPMTMLYSQNLVWLLLFNLLFPPTIMTLPTLIRSPPLIDYVTPVTIREMIHSIIRSHVATIMHEALSINCLNSNL